MEIKTKYNIGDKVYYIQPGGSIGCNRLYSISSDKIVESEIEEINIEKDQILYYVNNKYIKESLITINKEEAKKMLICNVEEQLNEFMNQDNSEEIKETDQLIELYRIIKTAKKYNCGFKIVEGEE